MKKNNGLQNNLLRLVYSILLSSIIVISCYGQMKSAPLYVEDTVNTVKFKVFSQKNEEGEISLPDLKGKVVILEFWATWCGPCIPHLYTFSDLQKRFKDSICVIGISQESKNDIRRTINKMPKCNILFSSDTNHVNFFKYDIVPTSVVIDKKGIIRGITSPVEITEDKIRKILKDEYVNFEAQRKLPRNTAYSLANPNLYRGTITGYDSASSTGIEMDTVSGSKKLAFLNFTLPSLFREVFKMPSQSWLINNTANPSLSVYAPENMYCLRLDVPYASVDDLYKEARRILNSSLPYVGKKMNREVDAYELLYKPTKDRKLRNIAGTNGSFSYYGPNFKGKSVNIKSLLDYLSNELGYLQNKIVLDETGLRGQYDINLQWEYTDIASLSHELSRYGLLLKKKKRVVELLVVLPRK